MNMMKPLTGLFLCALVGGAYALNSLPDDPPSKSIKLTPTIWSKGHKAKKTETATFAGGCFWGIENGFRKTPGVLATAVGYTGGVVPFPTYKQVCSKTTGHTEAVRLTFDPSVISYEKLTEKFFTMINPTQLNFQGPDYGTNYRSGIYYHSDAQRKTAQAILTRLNTASKHKGRVVTELLAAPTFYMAEDYHQQFDEKRGIESCPTPDP